MRGKQEDHDKQAEEEVRMANVLKQKPETIESTQILNLPRPSQRERASHW